MKCFRCNKKFIDNKIILSNNSKYFICENCTNDNIYDNELYNEREASIEIGTEIIDDIFNNNLISNLDNDSYILIFNIFFIDNKKNIYEFMPNIKYNEFNKINIYHLNKINK